MSCISNSAYQSAEKLRTNAVLINAGLKSAQLVYEAARSGQELIDNYRKQHELAKRAQAIAEAIQGQQSMFWAAEQQFKNEFINPEPIEDVEVMARRYAGRLVSSVLGAFAPKIHEVKCNMNRYCTSGNMKALQDIYLVRSFSVATARTLGRNIAHAEWQARNDLNWERRKQAAALGRKLTGDASGLIKSAGAGLASIGAGHEQSLNSALKALGLAITRPDMAPENPNARAQAGYTNMTQDNFQEQMSYYSSQANDEYNYGSMGTGSGPLQVQGANSMASSFSNNQTDPPSDLITEADFRSSTADGDELPSLHKDGSNQNINGPLDKVRRGSVVFPVVGGSGGQVRVDMDKFEVGYADHLDANEVKAVTPQNPSNWPT